MHRFYVPPAELKSPNFALPDAEARHASQVLRIRSGEVVTALDGAGRVCQCEVESVEKRQVWVKILEDITVQHPDVQVEVYPSVAKGKAMDFIIQKVTELGATAIHPVVTEHSVAQMEGERAEGKAEKWRQTAIETLKQCGNPWLPEIFPAVPFGEALPTSEDDRLDLVAALQPKAHTLRHCLEAYKQEHQRLPKIIGLWVGPEGDFSPAEYSMMTMQGFHPVSLGVNVLRCETAVLAMLSICNYELQCAQIRG